MFGLLHTHFHFLRSAVCLGWAVWLSAMSAGAQTVLENAVDLPNLAGAASSETFYKISVPAGRTSLTFTISGGTGDCDMYVRYGQAPTILDWDYRPYSGGNNEVVTVPNPSSGDWHVMLRGWSEYSGVTLNAAYAPGLPNLDLGSGTINKTSFAAGELLTTTISVTNNGAGPSAATTMSYYFGPDTWTTGGIPFPYTSQTFVGAVTVPALAAGATSTAIVHTFTVPGAISSGTYSFAFWIDSEQTEVESYESDNQWIWRVLNISGAQAPNQPMNLTPVDGATWEPLSPTLTASAFSDPDGDTHVASEWQILDPYDGWVIWSSGETAANKTAIQVPLGELWNNSELSWQVRYKDSRTAWSEWSEATTFTTEPNLQHNVPLRGIFGAFASERRFSLQTSPGQSRLHFEISGGTGDCDMYVKRGASPTTASWDFRPYLSGNEESVDVLNPAADVWHVMLRAYADYSDVTLRVWEEQTLTNQQTLSALTGEGDSQRIFAINVPASQASFQVVIGGGTGDCDLYVSQNRPPTTEEGDWLERPYLGGNEESVTINNPTAGVWYVMLHGFDEYEGLALHVQYGNPNLPPATPVNLSPTNGALVTTTSPLLMASAYSDPAGEAHAASEWEVMDTAFFDTIYSEVSTVSKTQFLVPDGYLDSGQQYSWRVRYRDNGGFWSEWSLPTTFLVGGALRNNVPLQSLSGAAGSETRLTFHSSPGQSQLHLKLTGGTGNAHLYVRAGTPPTRTAYSFASATSTNEEEVIINSPAEADWHILIYGATAYSGLTAWVWEERALADGVALLGLDGEVGSQQIFYLDVPSGQASLTVSAYGGTGDADLYVRSLLPPTINPPAWDERPYLGGNDETVTIMNPVAGRWRVMLNGYSSYQDINLQGDYEGGNQPPAAPTGLSPVNGAANVSLTPTLSASAFQDPEGGTHFASQWLITTQTGILVWDSGEDRNQLTSAVPPAGLMLNSTAYSWQVRYADAQGAWSAYSALLNFTTVPPSYAVTPSAGAGGTISPAAVQTVLSGGSVTFNATPNTGYIVAGWTASSPAQTVTQTGGTSLTLINVTSAWSVQVSFVQTFAVTPSAGANGSISPSVVQTVSAGGGLTFTATPNSGYIVDQWKRNGTTVQTGGTAFSLTNVTANTTVQVTFKTIPAVVYSVTPQAGSNGTISPATVQTVASGGSVSFTAIPNSGYVVDVWQLNGATAQTGGTTYIAANVTSNRTVRVVFKTAPVTTYTVTASAGANGTINPAGAITVNSGASRSFTATPSAGFLVDRWFVGGVQAQVGGTTLSLTNITTNRTVSVTFKPGSFTMTVGASPAAWGTVTGGGAVLGGTMHTVAATPATGYKFTSWKEGSTVVSSTKNYTFYVTTSRSLTAFFEVDTSPVLTTTLQPPGVVVAKPNLTVTGSATDNQSVTSVQYRLDMGSWQSATGTTAWSISLTLAPGRHVLSLRALDNQSNYSQIVQRTIEYIIPQAQPIMAGLQKVGNTFSCTIVGAAGMLCDVRKTTDLQSWQAAGRVTISADGVATWQDTAATSQCAQYSVSYPTPTVTSFTEAFTRANSMILGNGWANASSVLGNGVGTAGSIGGSWQIQGNRAEFTGTNGGAAAYRPLSATTRIRVQATLFPKSGPRGLQKVYDHFIGVKSDGRLGHGYFLHVNTSSKKNLSAVALLDSGTLVSTSISSFVFGDSVRITADFWPDGRVDVTLQDPAAPSSQFQYAFPAWAVLSTGGNLIFGASSSPGPLWSGFDDLSYQVLP